MFFQLNAIKKNFWQKRSYVYFMMIFLAFGCASEKNVQNEDRSQNDSETARQGSSGAGMPYRVNNITYYPLSSATGFTQEGIASWYGPNFNGKLTSNQEVYNMNEMTAAHKTLPFNTRVKVINLKNGRQAEVRINDRGPFVNNRIIDLSYKAAKTLGVVELGTASVRIVAINDEGNNSAGNNSPHAQNYAIQVGSFRDINNARQFSGETRDSRIIKTTRDQAAIYLVVIGKYTRFDKAHEHKEQLQSQGFPNAFIVSEN